MSQAKWLEPTARPTEDTRLAEALINGDETAFRCLYRRQVGRVRSTLVLLAGSAHLDDMTQEVFLKIWRSRATLRSATLARAWIYRITVNVAMEHLRSRLRMKLQALPDSELMGVDPRNSYEARQAVAAALAILDPAHRCTIILHDLEELTEAEVGEVLGIPRGTVKSRLFHARRKMREYLEEKGIKP